jgi:hypothetical protein
VELQLAQMKSELNPPAAAPSGELGAGTAGAAASDEPVDGEIVPDLPVAATAASGAPAAPKDPFTLDDANAS